jgi:hypothetical protein
VNFAAKRLVDMRYVGRLDRATTEWHSAGVRLERRAVSPSGPRPTDN